MSASDPLRPRRHRLGARAAALVLLGAFGLWGGPSCTAALSLDSYRNAPEELCAKLSDCYADGAPPACKDRLDARLAGDPDQDNGWLHAFSTETCLLNCASARRCLDNRPVCAEITEACQSREDCCGFITGVADCVNGLCCTTAGAHCGDDPMIPGDAECCANAGYCDDNRCGGRVCTLAKGPCRFDDDCCSKRCLAFECAETICSEKGFECAADTDCCTGHCEADGRCGDSCAAEGGVCDSRKPCCGSLMCLVPPNADSGVCSTGACLPEGVECVPGLPCCPGLACDATHGTCAKPCVDTGGACSKDGECCSASCQGGTCVKPVCSEAYCSTDADCCSGTCLHATCKPSCSAVSCHGACTEGAPLDSSCSTLNLTCIKQVCTDDPYCCCSAWDTLCISHVVALAGTACAGVCP